MSKNHPTSNSHACGSLSHFNRRTLLKAAGASGLAWLTPIAESLAIADEKGTTGRAKSIILLWLAGAPSQLETFDPHPGKNIAAETKAISTSLKNVQLAEGMERIAEEMHEISVVRNVVSKEGDHERAFYNVKTGYRPDPTLVHPALGAVLAHQLPNIGTEIPRHVSIVPNAWPGRGGYLGNKFDAFLVNDPQNRVPDVTRPVSKERFERRVANLDVLEKQFTKGRLKRLEQDRTLHKSTIDQALRMMDSEQLTAFDVKQESKEVLRSFGDTAFGRGCLAAARLVQHGVRCVEVTLDGWDSHVNNHEIQSNLKGVLDPAFAALIKYLRDRDLLDDTIVLCGGEFGRTPSINPAGGRDHWPHGFSIALAGGGIRRGHIVGQTDPDGGKVAFEKGVPIEDIHATVMAATGIDFQHELDTPVGRPMKLSQGKVINELL